VDNSSSPVGSPENCPGNCSGHGVCSVEHRACLYVPPIPPFFFFFFFTPSFPVFLTKCTQYCTSPSHPPRTVVSQGVTGKVVKRGCLTRCPFTLFAPLPICPCCPFYPWWFFCRLPGRCPWAALGAACEVSQGVTGKVAGGKFLYSFALLPLLPLFSLLPLYFFPCDAPCSGARGRL